MFHTPLSNIHSSTYTGEYQVNMTCTENCPDQTAFDNTYKLNNAVGCYFFYILRTDKTLIIAKLFKTEIFMFCYKGM